jgi:hypothetical protein
MGWISFLPKTQFSSFAEYMFDFPGTVITQALLAMRVNRGKVYAFGQCNMFARETYEALGGHREIGHLVAESHALAQLAKDRNIAMRCEIAYQQCRLTWYHDFWECWKGFLKSVQARLTKKLPIIGRPMPQSVMIVVGFLFVFLVALPSCVFLLQLAKLATVLIYSPDSWADTLSNRDFHAGLAALASILTAFLKRALGWCALGYDMHYWWLLITSTVLQACLIVCACQVDTKGRWAVGQKPEDSVLPKEAPWTAKGVPPDSFGEAEATQSQISTGEKAALLPGTMPCQFEVGMHPASVSS